MFPPASASFPKIVPTCSEVLPRQKMTSGKPQRMERKRPHRLLNLLVRRRCEQLAVQQSVGREKRDLGFRHAPPKYVRDRQAGKEMAARTAAGKNEA